MPVVWVTTWGYIDILGPPLTEAMLILVAYAATRVMVMYELELWPRALLGSMLILQSGSVLMSVALGVYGRLAMVACAPEILSYPLQAASVGKLLPPMQNWPQGCLLSKDALPLIGPGGNSSHPTSSVNERWSWLSPKVPVDTQIKKLSYHPGPLQGFELAHANIYPI